MASDSKLWKAFSLFIRLRDSDKDGFCKCYTCGAIRRYGNCDAGHGIGRQHKSTKFDEKNVKSQCKICNGFHGGKREKFKEAMDKEHGPGTWDLMEFKARKPSKWSQFEFDVLTDHYRREVAKLKKEKGLK